MDVVKYLLNIFLNIKKDDIKKFIDNNGDIITLIENNLNKITLSIVKFLGRMYWKNIEPYLTDTNKALQLILKYRPDLKDILDTPKGRMWLYNTLKKLYPYLYNLIWK